jgi:hypothetical protein
MREWVIGSAFLGGKSVQTVAATARQSAASCACHAELAVADLSSVKSWTVSWHSAIDEIPRELFNACFRPPLEGRWWYEALEKCGIEDQFKFQYAVVLADEKAVAVVPSFVMNVPMDLVAPEPIAKVLDVIAKVIPGVNYQKTLFVGSPCADEGTVGMLPGVSLSDIMPALQNALWQKARQLKMQVIAWKDFPEVDCPHLDGLVATSGYFKMPSYPGTILQLPQGNFEKYLQELKQSRRYNLRKKLKRSKLAAALDYEVIQKPDADTLGEIFSLFWQTYEHGKTKFERLNLEFFRLISLCENSHFVLVRARDNKKLLAFMLCFKVGDRIINKFIGIDYSADPQLFLYFRLWEAAVTWAMSEGAREFQSGQTGYRAKRDVGCSLVPLFNYCRNLNPLMNKIYGHLSGTVTLSTLDSDLELFEGDDL